MKQFKRSLSLLLVMAILLSMVYAGPVTQAHADASSYISATYAANLSVKTTKTTILMREPSAEAASAYSLPKDTMLSVKALYMNTSGAYWYEVLYYDMTLYVDATATTLVDHLTGDVTVTDLLSPAALGTGQGFPISGTVSSTLNKLGKITASVHYHSNIHKEPAITSSDTVNGYSYSLKGSTVDNNMIYSDLAAGSYTHILTVEAISYYINDSGALATSTQTVVLDNKPLVVTTANSTNPIVARGIDVSVWNGDINWASVASQVDFAILRIGYEYTLDTKFTQNAAGCNANGIPFGVYIYSYAESEAEAIAEAEFVISVLKNYDVDLPIYFDIEDECQSSLGAATIQKIVKAFCETIKDAGYEPGLYTFLSWFNSYFGDTYYNSLPKWVAQVGTSSCSYAKGLTMWQYSWTGSFTGMSGDVDCNYCFGEFPGINSDTSYLSKCTYYPSNLDVTLTDSAEMRQYPSSDYTLLETLPAGTKLHATGLYKNAYGNFWYQVEKDGVTGYVYYDCVSVDQCRYDDLSVVDPTMDDLALNAGYYLKGRLRSVYNNMYKVYAKVYSGEDTMATPVLSSSATPNDKKYILNYSDVCDNMIFSDLDTGYYTYEISTDVRNYYVSGGSLTSETENVVLWTAPFTVGNASIDPPESVVCEHAFVTEPAVAPTCTATGLSEGSYCSKCGEVFAVQVSVPATGHNYTTTVYAASCLDYERVEYTCGSCGDNYSVYSGQTDWVETAPEGDVPYMESKTQYRYSDYETFTSNTANLAGYTQIGKKWVQTANNAIHYASDWPSGYDTSHSLYSQYNKTPYTASETATAKTEVGSAKIIGYIYYHWCIGTYTEGPINRATSPTKTDRYSTFHSFVANVSTQDPTTLTPADDGSVTYPVASACTDSHWWYYFPVYEQSYTTYKAEFTYERWTDWSDWSDTAVTATNTRKVESRTLYRYVDAELGDHNYVDGQCSLCGAYKICPHPSHNTDGVCLSCGETVTHNYVNGLCTVCGKEQMIKKITPVGTAVSFRDEARVIIYFTTENLGDVAPENMGLLIWSVPQANGTIDTAQTVISGASVSATVAGYEVITNGIAAKRLGDNIYFKIYAKLDDGSYVYSPMLSTSPKTYAMNMIKKTTSSQKLKSLCVSLLNYGAAAQQYFGYKTYDLMNAGLTDAQRAMVQEYSETMVLDVPSVGAKGDGFVRDASAFSEIIANVNFGSAFAINYYFTPAHPMDGNMTLYYWGPVTVASVSELTTENATGYMTMELRSGRYWGDLSGIAARQINQAAYVAGVYESGGVTYTTGILSYSLGQYCKNIAAKEGGEAQELAKCTAIYGYYAKKYFG